MAAFQVVMHAYFRGERIESLYVIAPLGLACVIFGGALLLSERSAFFVSVAVPSLPETKQLRPPWVSATERQRA
jgi:hypothetical protein